MNGSTDLKYLASSHIRFWINVVIGLILASGLWTETGPTMRAAEDASESAIDISAIQGLAGSGETKVIEIGHRQSINNRPPDVDAGSGKTIALLNDVALNGMVSDDGLPTSPGEVTTTWSQVSGPGIVTFANPDAVDTTASFSEVGAYVLHLTATAGELTAGDEVAITVDPLPAATIRVPQDQPTIQAGIDAAPDGGLVLVSPGTYSEQLTLSGKTITLASQFYTSGDSGFIDQTIIDGQNNTVITVDQSVGPQTKIIGFTIQNGNDGISASAKLHILNNRFTGHSDAIDYEGGGGVCRHNVFENNSDDAIDLDGLTEAVIEDNIIRNNGDDGIEIRLHAYSGSTLHIIIRDNIISGNDEDGIQLIDYPDLSDRVFFIERNLIENNAQVGLGLMDNGDTNEDFRAASIPERIHLFNNTFINNPYALTGGDNLIALNNLFVQATIMALKEVDGDSMAAYNLFWNNAVDNQGSNIDLNSSLFVDPLRDSNARLQPGSPAIDAGTARYALAGDEIVLDLPSSAYFGAAPDLGAFESNLTAPTTQIVEVRVSASSDDAEERVSGSVALTSSDLELVFDGGGDQIVGMRFNEVAIPRGAIIRKAYIQFQVDETMDVTTSLNIQAEAVDNAATFVDIAENISSRAKTTAAVPWAPVPWPTTAEAGPDQQTPDITPVLQEIIDRPGWSSGNSLVIIITGTGERVAEAYDGVPEAAPLLHVEFDISGENIPPSVTINSPTNNSTFTQDSLITFNGIATDTEDGDVTASLAWESNLDGSLGSGGSFSRSDLSVGTHTITAQVTDSGNLTTADSIMVTVVTTDTAVLVGAGDIAGCSSSYKDEATALLLDTIAGTVFTLGDNVYPDGTDQQFSDCYDPTWGRHKARTRPAPGNHDYHTPGAAGYYNYFGPAAGEPDKGYYSYNVGNWHIIVLNSECSDVGGCDTGSAQWQWLQADLAANPRACTLAYWHHPRFSSGRHGNSTRSQDFWQLLYDVGADVILNGHDHTYERFAPQDPNGNADPERGIREFVVGTGGTGLYDFGTPEPNSEVRENSTHGVLKLTLHQTSYDWEFIPIAGQTFTDSGSASCVLLPSDNQPPTVDAGSDQTITFPSSAMLTGTVSDDGLPNPPGVVNATWSQVSGPGPVIFTDVNAINTSVSFSQAGPFVLRLTADDSQLTTSDTVVITVMASAINIHLPIILNSRAIQGDGRNRLST